MINVAHGISFFIDLGLSGWPHEPGRAANRPLGAHVRQLAARVNGESSGNRLIQALFLNILDPGTRMTSQLESSLKSMGRTHTVCLALPTWPYHAWRIMMNRHK